MGRSSSLAVTTLLVLSLAAVTGSLFPELIGILAIVFGYPLLLLGFAIGMIAHRETKYIILWLMGAAAVLIGTISLLLISSQDAPGSSNRFEDHSWYYSSFSWVLWGFLGLSCVLACIGWGKLIRSRFQSGNK